MTTERSDKYTVTPGTPVEHLLRASTPATISVVSANTLVIKVKITEDGDFIDIPDGNLMGTLSAAAIDVLMGPAFALQFTATTNVAVIEVSQ